MFYEFDNVDYSAIVNSIALNNKNPNTHRELYMRNVYRDVIHSIVSRYGNSLTSSEFQILCFIADRTLYYTQLSQQVYRPQFTKGMVLNERDQRVFSGIKISEMTLMKSLRSLVDQDFIHVGARKDENGVEKTARIYAINCKKVADIDVMDEEKPMILKIPKEKVEQERGVLAVPRAKKVAGYPPLNLDPLYTFNIDTKVSLPSPDGSGAERVKRVVRSTGLQSIAKQSGPTSVDTIRARIETMQNAAAVRKAAFAVKAKATGPEVSQRNLQAIIDPLMQQFFPQFPTTLVTAKPFGKLRKDLNKQPLPDLTDFFQFVISSWSQIASDHSRAAAKAQRDGRKTTYDALPRTPEFSTLAYRFSYFLKCYNSYVANRLQLGDPDKRKDAENEKIRRQLEHAREEARSLRVIARNRDKERKQAPTPTRPVRQTRVADEDYVPTWAEHTKTNKRG